MYGRRSRPVEIVRVYRVYSRCEMARFRRSMFIRRRRGSHRRMHCMGIGEYSRDYAELGREFGNGHERNGWRCLSKRLCREKYFQRRHFEMGYVASDEHEFDVSVRVFVQPNHRRMGRVEGR